MPPKVFTPHRQARRWRSTGYVELFSLHWVTFLSLLSVHQHSVMWPLFIRPEHGGYCALDMLQNFSIARR